MLISSTSWLPIPGWIAVPFLLLLILLLIIHLLLISSTSWMPGRVAVVLYCFSFSSLSLLFLPRVGCQAGLSPLSAARLLPGSNVKGCRGKTKRRQQNYEESEQDRQNISMLLHIGWLLTMSRSAEAKL